MKNFGEELKRIRESRGMTLNQLAMYSGITGATISRIETGKRGVPKPGTIRQLSEALKFPYDELMKLAGHVDRVNEDEFIESVDLELTDEQILEKFNVTIDGKPLGLDEAKDFIAFVRAKRSLK